ncbi:MAG: DUF1211 domain-containing protein [Leptolyngbya sp. SIOISBB]|nr:DUF1211 domain-containing protein [Leptolyngbya sp. SIOISBB]
MDYLCELMVANDLDIKEPAELEGEIALQHLSRLSDFIFALAMALTFWQFDMPETASTLSPSEVNQFLLGELKPLSTYIITFLLIAVYWIAHTEQFAHYRRTNEVHLWIYAFYLMCLFLVPYSNAVALVFPDNTVAKICFSANIALIGLISYLSWHYATDRNRLVKKDLSAETVTEMKRKVLIEPICAVAVIGVAAVSPVWSDAAWLLFPFVNLALRWLIKPTATTL